jgi:hypothetical protein
MNIEKEFLAEECGVDLGAEIYKQENREIFVAPGSDGVKELMDIFYKTNPTLNWANKTYRTSAKFLIEKFGAQETLMLAQLAVALQGKQYAPQITNPWELKEKFLKIKLYFDREAPKIPNREII